MKKVNKCHSLSKIIVADSGEVAKLQEEWVKSMNNKLTKLY